METLDLQKLVNEINPEMGGVIEIGAGAWALPSTVRFAGHQDVRIRTAGQATRLYFDGIAEAGPMIDLTDSTDTWWEPCQILARGAARPLCGILLSRRAGRDCGGHHFEGVAIAGHFAQSPVLAFGSECNSWDACEFQQAEPGQPAYQTSHEPVCLDGTPLPLEGGSNMLHSLRSCVFANYQPAADSTGAEVGVWLGRKTANVHFDTCFFSNRAGWRGGSVTRAGVVIGEEIGDPIRLVKLTNCDFETESALATIAFAGPAQRISLEGCELRARREHISGRSYCSWLDASSTRNRYYELVGMPAAPVAPLGE